MTVRSTGEGVEISVRAQPRASRSEVVGLLGEELKIRLAAPPVDGAANDELVRLLAKLLGVSRSAVEVVRGHSNRSKVVRVAGIDPTLARERLGL